MTAMPDQTLQLHAIVRNYAHSDVPLGRPTTLREAGIDRLDLPMIALDIEDAFDVHFGPIDDGLSTVGDLIDRLQGCLAAKAMPRARRQRRRSSWMSTSAS
jgi:hypothetical protein